MIAAVAPLLPTDVLRFEGRDGLVLAGDRRGRPDDPPVLFLHGGGQTRHSWHGTATAVAERGWQALTIDARGHGESAWSSRGDYRLSSFAEDVRRVIDRLPERPVLVGASLGGLTAILLTGELHPGVARGVILVDIIPDMEAAGAERIQAFMAEHAVDGFASLDEVADAVAAYNPHRPRPSDLAGLRKNVRERDGRFYWHWDPSFIGGTADFPPSEVADAPRLHAAVARMVADVPVMLVRGRASDLVSSEKAAAFCARYPEVEFVDVSGAGHMVAGDRNDAFTAAVLRYLEELAPNPGH
jgi:pimeloyl-ACP methyl ester carboxylesterase